MQDNKILPFLPGLLLFAAWPMSPFTFLIFVALVPLFLVEHTLRNTSRFFFILWLNLLFWNLATTWWIWNASPGGAVGAIVANSLLMCFPWMFYRFTKKRLGLISGLLSFITYWITWEYIHHNWDLSWPWLTLGNVFSTSPGWIQWYEYTGTTGGTLWILLVNALVFYAIVKKTDIKRSTKTARETVFKLAPAVFILVFPSILSVGIYSRRDSGDGLRNSENVVVVQPNVEPYTEKFNTDPQVLIEKMVRLSEQQIDEHTRLVIWPETAIPVQVWEDQIGINANYQQVFAFAKRHPQIQLLSGIDSYKNWGFSDKKGFSIRTLTSGEQYEAFNTAFETDSSGEILLYHKSKLVPGVETLPAWLNFMSDIFDDLGGTTGSLGKSDSAIVFSTKGNPYQSAPIICYESIYSDYVTDYAKRGANLLTIITNDGWWGETPGYKQHMNMARLRAIENRRWVARSANTGISCFISPMGEVINPQPWDTAAAIKLNVPPLAGMTFYATYGDWLSRAIWPLALLSLIITLVVAVRNRNRLTPSG